MLELLRIKNFALFKLAEIEFHKGLNVITGESGSGKSVILKAIDFALGGKIPESYYKVADDKVQVELMFVFNNEELIIKREISLDSKRSRFYINGSLATLKQIKELREGLLLYAAQDAQRVLTSPRFHTDILDSFIPEQISDKKGRLLKKVLALSQQIKELEEDIQRLIDKKSMWEFQLKEIEKIGPKVGEERELEAKRQRLKKQAELQIHVQKALELLDSDDGLVHLLGELQSSLGKLSDLDSELNTFFKDLEESFIMLNELKHKLINYPLVSDVEHELESIEERLWKLSQLKKRFNCSIEEIINIKENKQRELSKIEENKLRLNSLKKELTRLVEELKEVVGYVNGLREEKADYLSNLLREELISLGFNENVKILFKFYDKDLFDGVLERRAEIFWQPNSGVKPMPLGEVASGGELSRIFIAFMLVSSKNSSKTLIFDEVESGIGGITLQKVGEKIKKISNKHQVIMVSHWPNIAYLADRHFFIEKKDINDRTFSTCVRLDGSEVLEELARMAGGGDKGMMLAKKLLEEKDGVD